jgi:hypothetical protein
MQHEATEMEHEAAEQEQVLQLKGQGQKHDQQRNMHNI